MKKKNTQKPSTQSHLNIAEIRDSIVVLKDGGLRLILAASSVNFALKSEGEQNAIIYGYQNFLNSLTFTTQIVMQSRRIDLQKYLATLKIQLKKETNELLQIQISDYIAYIKKLTTIANIMEKRFYIVVPFTPPKVQARSIFDKIFNPTRYAGPIISEMEFKKYKEEMLQRANVVSSGLGALSVKVKMLSTQQVIELLYTSYNLDEAETEKLIAVKDLSSAVVEKKEEKKDNIH